MAKTPLEMPRGNLATGKKNVWAFAGTPENLAANALVFAGTPASLAANALAFAGLPQVSRQMLWRLRDSRKSRGKCFGVCGTPASLAANALAFAGLPRGISKNVFALAWLP